MHRKSRIIQIAPDKRVHKSCAIQTPTGKPITGIVDHTNQEYIRLGTDLDHGIGYRDLICLMCAKLKFQTSKFNPLVVFKKQLFTRYQKPSRSLFFCQRDLKSALALTSQLVRVQGEMYHWAGKGNSLAFRSTASHRLAISMYSYKYHRYKTNTSTIHTRLEGYDAVSSKLLCVTLLRQICNSHTLTVEHLPSALVLVAHRCWVGPIPSTFCPLVALCPFQKKVGFCSPRLPLRSHTSCAPVLVYRLVGA